jgi:hypothetical protein
MAFWEIFQNKKEENSDLIGKFECAGDKLVDAIMGICQRMNMINPGTVAVKGSKAISIKRSGDKYIIRLLAYNPPIELIWSDLQDMEGLQAAILEAVAKNKKIGFINVSSTSEGQIFQLALA